MRVKCITCFELIVPSESLLSLPCGHVFHTPCILQWFENKKNCPQCRHSANEKNSRRIYLSEMDDEEVDPDDIQKKLEHAEAQLRTLKTEKKNMQGTLEESKNQLSDMKSELRTIDKSKRDIEEKNKQYKLQISRLRKDTEMLVTYKEEAEQTKGKLEKFELLSKILTQSAGDVNMMLHERGYFDHKSRDLATFVVQLKKNLVEVKKQRSQAEQKLENFAASRDDSRKKIVALSRQISDLEKLREELKECRDQACVLSEERDKLEERLAEKDRLIERLQQEGNLSGDRASSADEEELQVLPASPPNFHKPSQVRVGEKRKPLTEIGIGVKRGKFLPNLMELGVQRKPGQVYDGFGGNSKPDIFPEPVRKLSKKSVPKKSSLMLSRERQQQDIHKFFGSLEN